MREIGNAADIEQHAIAVTGLECAVVDHHIDFLRARPQDFFRLETFGRGEGSAQWKTDRRADLYRAAVQNGCCQGGVAGVDEGAAESEADGLFAEMHDLVV